MHKFKLPELPYGKDSFPNQISAEMFDYHYGKHHLAYINNLNSLVQKTDWEGKQLDEIVLKCKDKKIYNNAAQHWNHSFYWYCITPKLNHPEGDLLKAINSKWGSLQSFLKELQEQALANFGSGWTWLVKNGKQLSIVNTSNADNPLTNGMQPLLVLDVWEHAYYIDYRNARGAYIRTFTNLVNWKFVQANFKVQQVRIKL